MQALAGLRILDFTQVLAGPFATQQLAGLGAHVIKVETIGAGDMTRGGLLRDEHGPTAPSFTTCNLGKHSIAIDLKDARGAEIIKRLIPDCDVLVENFKPGVMTRLGFSYDVVRALRPDIIYCSISGYGQTGPAAEQPAFDGAIQAASGMMSITGHAETGPVRTGFFAVDMSTALNAAFAISAALLRRERTGEGQRLDVSMLDTAMMMIAPQMSAYLANGTLPDLLGNRSPTRQPTANVFTTADGYIQIAALSERHVQGLFDLLGLSEISERFPDSKSRIANNPQITDALNAALSQRSTTEWQADLIKAGIPVAQVRSLDAVARDEQLATRPSIQEVPVSNGASSTVKTVVASHTASSDAPVVQGAAPSLGEHTDGIMQLAGYSAAQIADLRTAGVIG